MVLLVVGLVFGLVLGLVFVFGLLVWIAVKRQGGVARHADIDSLRTLKLPPNSLFRLFQPHLVPLEDVKAKGGGAALSIVQAIIGVQPTSNMVLSIWKPAYECYNLFVPNCLNLPLLLLPGNETLRHLVPLTGYVVSRANQCGYCSVHCCSFATRRGIDPSLLRAAMNSMLQKEDEWLHTAAEKAVVRVAYGLGTVPACLTADDCADLYRQLTKSQVEWIVAATAMFGAFNKYMEALALPIEQEPVNSSLPHMDDWFKLSNMIDGDCKDGVTKEKTQAPHVGDWTVPVAMAFHALKPGGALAKDKQLQEGVPVHIEDCITYLKAKTGVAMPVLGKLQHCRFRRALTAILAKNMVSDGLSLRIKVLAGIEFCKVLQNPQLQTEYEAILKSLEQNAAPAEILVAEKPTSADLVLRAAKAMTQTPSRMTKALIDEIEASSDVTAANMVELVSFLAVTQALHRVETFFRIAEGGGM